MVAEGDRRTQILKGVLDLCVLAVLSNGPTYGYGLVEALKSNGLPLVAEGTVYPLLARLAKAGLVRTYEEPSPSGPPRKYYAITAAGRSALNSGTADWIETSKQISTLMRRTHVART